MTRNHGDWDHIATTKSVLWHASGARNWNLEYLAVCVIYPFTSMVVERA